MKIKNRDIALIKMNIPIKHDPIICSKCGMSSVYGIVRCWYCLEPFKTNEKDNDDN